MMHALDWVITGFWTLIGVGVAAVVAWLVVAAVQHSRKRHAVEKALAQATPEQISRIVDLAGSIGTEPSVGGVLVETDERASGQTVISIPENIHDFPWVGQSVFLTFDPEPAFSLSEESVAHTLICGRVYRYMAVPRIKTKTGKLRNVFDLTRYPKLNPELSSAVAKVCEDYPQATLSAILWNGNLDSPEPVDQLRIGTSAAWMQEPEWQYCGNCGKRMRLIVQFPGPCTEQKDYRDCTLYFFGCAAHPLETNSVVQFD